MDGLDAGEPVARRCLARGADEDAEAAQLGSGTEAVFIGQIVAHDDRTRTGERRFRHQRANRIALVGAGRAQLDDHLAALDGKAGAGGEAFGERQRRRLALGSEPIVERDAGRLVLDEEARRVGREGGERRARLGEGLGPPSPASTPRKFQAVGARGGEMRRGEMAVEIGEGTAGEDGEPPPERGGDAVEQGWQVARHGDPIGAIGKGDQSPVEIEEQRRFGQVGERRRRVGGVHAEPMPKCAGKRNDSPFSAEIRVLALASLPGKIFPARRIAAEMICVIHYAPGG